MSSINGVEPTNPVSKRVPLGKGPPTKDELLYYYPAKFTWEQLKTFINSGDLGLLKRDRLLQKRYDDWAEGLKVQYGSIVNYLLNYRLQWGKRDTLSLLPSSLESETYEPAIDCINGTCLEAITREPLYFTARTPPNRISIIQNDWPYSVPSDVEHTLIWTCVPIIHPSIVPEAIAARVEQDGIWGFTGTTADPPSPSTLPSCLPALSEWGVTMDKLVRSKKAIPEECDMLRQVGCEVHEFVTNRWVESKWETAWFVNPTRLQSVPGLAHIHVFAKRKAVEEMG